MSDKTASQNYEELVATCDSLIKSGKVASVSAFITRLNFAKVPRKWRQPLAKICRRAGLVDQGLRLLQPIVRNDQPLVDPATPTEVCEYSVLLSRIGSIEEALVLLSDVDSGEAPEALLYQAFCNISKWEYGKAATFLEAFLRSGADDYSKLVASVNLGSSYLSIGQLDAAEDVLSRTIPVAEKERAARLVGNCLEIRAQVHLQRENFDRCRMDLEQAAATLGKSGSYDQLFIDKWRSIVSGLEQGATEPILKFRKEAYSRKYWESVRDADLFMLKIRFDQRLFDHVLFGTPMEAYRDRIRQQLPHEPSPSYLFGRAGGNVLELATGNLRGSVDFNSGKKLHQFIAALVSDFYAPRNLGSLFSALYPGEFFDIDSSILRVRQVLKRTRSWLKANQIPAAIEQESGSYRLSITGAFAIDVPLWSPHVDSNSAKLEELRSHFSTGLPFTAEEACKKLEISRSSFLRLMEWAVERSEARKFGSGRTTYYGMNDRLARSPKAV